MIRVIFETLLGWLSLRNLRKHLLSIIFWNSKYFSVFCHVVCVCVLMCVCVYICVWWLLHIQLRALNILRKIRVYVSCECFQKIIHLFFCENMNFDILYFNNFLLPFLPSTTSYALLCSLSDSNLFFFNYCYSIYAYVFVNT